MGERKHGKHLCKAEARRATKKKHFVAACVTAAICAVGALVFHVEIAAKGTEWVGAAIVYWVAFGSIEV